MKPKLLISGILISVIILIFIFFSPAIYFAADWLWFSETGFTDILIKSLMAKLITGFTVGIIVLIFLLLNFYLATKSKIPWIIFIPPSLTGDSISLNERFVKRITLIISIIMAIFIGLISSTAWQDILKIINAVPFGLKDPIFGMDIGFYVFSLPVYSLIIGLTKFLLTFTLIVCTIIYVLRGSIKISFKPNASPPSRIHIGILLILSILILAISTYFSMFELLFTQGSPVTGAKFTDISISIPIIWITVLIYALAALAALFYTFSGKILPLLSTLILLIIVGFSSILIPDLMQRFIVAPNELNKETPFIKYNIQGTRHAYSLDKIEKRVINTDIPLTSEDIAKNKITVNNVRLWDRDPLLSTFSQIQEIRTYYEFNSIDNDRYKINGEIRQIMLSPRELASNSLPNRNWINEHLTFTHGYGIAAGPVNQVTPEGLPVLFVKDLPPKSDVKELSIKRPEIYYGEIANDFIIVNSKSKEFDYPKGDENVYTTYKGKGGVEIDSILKRFIYTLYFNSLKIFLSDDVTTSSRILYNRNVEERVEKIAPFLDFDSDPYLVLANGNLYWIIDAYTSSDLYPYSQEINYKNKSLNYIRNSVKAVVNAYDGKIDFYQTDQNDPIIKTYSKIFPGVFKPLSQMPEEILAHIRYPEEIFKVQTAVYKTYHMDSPQVFYNKEDQWEIPAISDESVVNTQTESEEPGSAMSPRHIIMKLPGEKTEEFILMQPFTPRSKDNLSAWMVARNDGINYGKLVVYSFPKDKLIFGPKQIIGRINQDPEVSRQISLWDQRGSQVIQGPLMVIPIENSLVYIRPLYLKAESGKIPELKRVIVAYENKIAMDETLEKALFQIFTAKVQQSVQDTVSTITPTPSVEPEMPIGNNDLIRQANEAYESALNAQKSGDWSKYGEEIKKLGDYLEKLNQ